MTRLLTPPVGAACHPQAFDASLSRRIVAIIGAAAAGKTTLATELAALMHATVLDPQLERPPGKHTPTTVAWTRLLTKLTATTGPTIVESCIAPAAYREILEQHNATIVLVEASRETRTRRLTRRRWNRERIADALDYIPPLEPHYTVNGTNDPTMTAHDLLSHMRPSKQATDGT